MSSFRNISFDEASLAALTDTVGCLSTWSRQLARTLEQPVSEYGSLFSRSTAWILSQSTNCQPSTFTAFLAAAASIKDFVINALPAMTKFDGQLQNFGGSGAGPDWCLDEASIARWSEECTCDMALHRFQIVESTRSDEDKTSAWHEIRSFLVDDLNIDPGGVPSRIPELRNPDILHSVEAFEYWAALKLELNSGRYKRVHTTTPLVYVRNAVLKQAQRHYRSQLKGRRLCAEQMVPFESYELTSTLSIQTLIENDVGLDLERGLERLLLSEQERELIKATFLGCKLADAPEYLGWDPKQVRRVARSLNGDRRIGRQLRKYFESYLQH